MAQIDITHMDTAAFLAEMRARYGTLFREGDATEVNARLHRVSEALPHAAVSRVVLHASAVQLVFSDTLQRGDLVALMDLRIVTGDGHFVFSCLDSYTEEEPSWGGGDSTFVGYVVAEFSRA